MNESAGLGECIIITIIDEITNNCKGRWKVAVIALSSRKKEHF